jgi:hypothetical protein
VSDYSSYSENVSESSDPDALQALEAQTQARSSNSARGSSSEENKHEIGYDGSGEDEDEDSEPQELLLVEGGNDSERGYTRPDEDGEVGAVVQEDHDGEESEAGSGEGEGLEDDVQFWSDQGSDSEFDEWKDYHEDDEAAALQSDEERLHEFEDILGAAEHAELWETRLYFSFCNPTFQIIKN